MASSLSTLLASAARAEPSGSGLRLGGTLGRDGASFPLGRDGAALAVGEHSGVLLKMVVCIEEQRPAKHSAGGRTPTV